MYNILLACDGEYYNKWAINCIKSIKFYVPWVVISTYIVNPINVIEIPEVRYFYEDKNFESEASKIAYYQAVRFLKCHEIFANNELVMSIDCDTLLQTAFSQKDFLRICQDTHVQRHQKDIRWMAGLVTYGTDSLFKSRLKEELLKIPIEMWRPGRDQDVLKILSEEFNFRPLYVGDWMSFGQGSGKFITLKGDQKIADGYLNVYSKILAEIES
jgi:hypothetical protein